MAMGCQMQHGQWSTCCKVCVQVVSKVALMTELQWTGVRYNYLRTPFRLLKNSILRCTELATTGRTDLCQAANPHGTELPGHSTAAAAAAKPGPS